MSQEEDKKVTTQEEVTDTTQTKPTGKDLRERFEEQLADQKAKQDKLAQEKADLQAQLAAIKQAEEDKNKSLEEKLAEANKKQEELNAQIELKDKQAQLDKALLKENINPEFVDLITQQGIGMYSEESTLNDVIANLKTKYPSAFQVANDRPANIGKPVTSAASSDTTITKEKAMEMVKDPSLYRKHRADIIAALNS